MASRPNGDVWCIVDNDKDSQWYGKKFKFDFSYILSEEIKEAIKEYTWINYIAGNKTVNGLYKSNSLLRAHIIPFLLQQEKIVSFNEVSSVTVDKMLLYLKTYVNPQSKSTLSYNSQRVIFSTFRTIILWLQLHENNLVTKENIFTGAEFSRCNHNLKIDYIPDQILSQINTALTSEENPYIKYGIIILQSTGMRIGDLLNLRLDCIKPHLINGYTIEWFQHKTRKYYSPIPVRSECVVAIEKIIEYTSEIRPLADEDCKNNLMIYQVKTGKNTGKVIKISHSTFNQTWLKRFVIEHDIKDDYGKYFQITSHQFRRTLGTDMLSKGININVIQQVLGHSDLYNTKRYYADIKDKERAEVFKSVGVIGNINQIQSSAFDNASEFEWFKANKYKSACMCDGYCTKPVVNGKICDRLLKRQKCYTCSRYITTPEYLEAHKQHLANLEKQLEEGAIYGEHYAEHFIPTIEVLKEIIKRLEELQNVN